VRASEVVNPRPGDQLTVGGEIFVVQGEPERRDGEQPPDQDLGHEAAPELRQDQRRRDQQRQDDREARPVDDSSAPGHFRVGTNRPVGRNNRVRISTTNDAMTAWAGLTQSEAFQEADEDRGRDRPPKVAHDRVRAGRWAVVEPVIGPAGYRSCLARAQARTAPSDEDLLAMRRAAWRTQGVVVLRPEDIRDDWTRQALINEANRLYGQRPGGDR
jgi:hypothetical protein